MTIDDFLKYIELELNRSPLTVAAYGRDLREFGAYLLTGDTRRGVSGEEGLLREASTADVRGWLASMARAGISPRSLRRKTQALRAYYRCLRKRGEVSVNPAAEIQLAKIGRKLPEFVREQEMERILDKSAVAANPDLEQRNRLMLNMFYTCGIRRAELISISDPDIDFHSKELRVHGKRDKTRIIPLPDSLLDEIRAWQETRDSIFTLNHPKPLFCTKNGRLTGQTVYEIVRKELMSTGSTHKGPHTIRHTFATSMLNGGAEINSVKELLGHASLQSTQIYTHLTFSDIRRAYDSAHPRATESDSCKDK